MMEGAEIVSSEITLIDSAGRNRRLNQLLLLLLSQPSRNKDKSGSSNVKHVLLWQGATVEKRLTNSYAYITSIYSAITRLHA